jgi:hypothetical protein
LTTFAQPITSLAPSAPIALAITQDGPGLVFTNNGPVLSANSAVPGLSMTTGGSAGTVTSVNGRIGAVLVLGPLVNVLTYSTVVTPNLAIAGHFRLLLTGNAQIANPANALQDGQRWMLEVQQDGVGGRQLTYGSKFNFGASIGVPALSTSPGKRDFLAFIYRLDLDLHDLVGFVSGY